MLLTYTRAMIRFLNCGGLSRLLLGVKQISVVDLFVFLLFFLPSVLMIKEMIPTVYMTICVGCKTRTSYGTLKLHCL